MNMTPLCPSCGKPLAPDAPKGLCQECLLQPENTTPSAKKHSFNWWGFFLWPFVILILYVLSGGPLAMMLERGHLSNNARFYEIYITPLAWAYETTPLHKPLGMYFRLWAPKSFDKNGNE
jgi:hypothetical protein